MNRNKSKKSHKSFGKRKSKKVQAKQILLEKSHHVTNRRLTNHCGIFGLGRSTGTVLRGPAIREETIARAEANLSKIIPLANSRNIVKRNFKNAENFYSDSIYNESDEHFNYCKNQKSFTDRNNTKHLKKRFSPKLTSTVKKNDDRRNSPCGSTVRGTFESNYKLQQEPVYESFKASSENKKELNLNRTLLENFADISSDDDNAPSHSGDKLCDASTCTNKTLKSEDIPYANFAKHLKSSLLDAAKALDDDSGVNHEVRRLLKDAYEHRSWKYTPPSREKCLSLRIKEFLSPDKAPNFGASKSPSNSHPKPSGSSSSSSSAITPNFDFTVCPPTLVVNPRGLIHRYEKKLSSRNSKESSSESKNAEFLSGFQSSSENPFATKTQPCIKDTPKCSKTVTYAPPKSVVVNPLSYIEKYEEIQCRDNINSNRIFQGRSDGTHFTWIDSEQKENVPSDGRHVGAWETYSDSNTFENYPAFYQYSSSNSSSIHPLLPKLDSYSSTNRPSDLLQQYPPFESAKALHRNWKPEIGANHASVYWPNESSDEPSCKSLNQAAFPIFPVPENHPWESNSYIYSDFENRNPGASRAFINKPQPFTCNGVAASLSSNVRKTDQWYGNRDYGLGNHHLYSQPFSHIKLEDQLHANPPLPDVSHPSTAFKFNPEMFRLENSYRRRRLDPNINLDFKE